MININDVLGHFVETEISLKSWCGDKTKHELTGRIIYSEYNASLFFKPKGSKNKGYLIENENDIHSVKVIRRDNRSNDYYIQAYNSKEQFEQQYNERLERETQARKEKERQRREQIELEEKRKEEERQKRIEEAKKLGGYEELENEVINFYKSFENDFFNEKFVTNTYIPILNKLIHKSINNVNEYPKYYFYKKDNPKFCSLIEKKLGIKLPNTQKGSVEVLNNYLAS